MEHIDTQNGGQYTPYGAGHHMGDGRSYFDREERGSGHEKAKDARDETSPEEGLQCCHVAWVGCRVGGSGNGRGVGCGGEGECPVVKRAKMAEVSPARRMRGRRRMAEPAFMYHPSASAELLIPLICRDPETGIY